MLERFTDRSRKVMQLANQEAMKLNHEYIGTEHILLGLAIEGSGVAANVLKNMQLDLREARREVEKLVQPSPHRLSAGTEKLPKTPRALKVIEYAIDEAKRLEHNYIGTEHLLLGLLREGEGVAASVLTNLEIGLDEVREEILHLVGNAPIAVEESSEFGRSKPSKPRIMIPVRLETADGALVAEEAVPPFLTPPEVVIWGQRFFRLYESGVYREAFTYHIVGREKDLL